jgi:hypothetical protein
MCRACGGEGAGAFRYLLAKQLPDGCDLPRSRADHMEHLPRRRTLKPKETIGHNEAPRKSILNSQGLTPLHRPALTWEVAVEQLRLDGYDSQQAVLTVQ